MYDWKIRVSIFSPLEDSSILIKRPNLTEKILFREYSTYTGGPLKYFDYYGREWHWGDPKQ